MREIPFDRAADAVERLCRMAACMSPPEAVMLLECASEEEDVPAAKTHLTALYENIIACGLENRPICREPSRAVLIVDSGLTVPGGLQEAAYAGLRRAMEQGYPYTGELEIRVDDSLPGMTLIPVCPRSESASFSYRLSPGPLEEQVTEFLADAMSMSPHIACFPAFIGMGMGADVDEALRLARDCLRWPLDQENDDPALAALERDALEKLCASKPLGNFYILSVKISAGRQRVYCAAVIGCHAVRRAYLAL